MEMLIIGSEGFIGSHCVDYFIGRGNIVTGLDVYDFPKKKYAYNKINRSSEELYELLKEHSFEVIINAAGSGNVPYSMTHPLTDFESNVLDTIKILDCLRKYQPGVKYIHFSSAAVYGNPVELPVSETAVAKPLSSYGWHKLMSEQLCMEYSKIFNIKTAILRPFSVYGPGLKKQLFWDLSQKLATSGMPVQLFGTGNESRDFIHVRDLVKAIDCILQYGKMEAEIYNVASGEETTISKVVAIFFRYLSPGTEWKFNHQVRVGDPLNWKACMNKLSNLGFKPSVQLDEGLKDLAEWIKKYDKE